MKKLIIFLFLSFVPTVFSQVVTWSPLFPAEDDTITIVFDATQGNKGLVGASDVYAHTGVITDQSSGPSDWKYVKTTWGQNTPDTRLESLGNDKWQIKFHIKSYYGVPDNEKILKLAFVFRNADASRECKTVENGDIFIPLYEQGLNISLLAPTVTPLFVSLGDTFQIVAVGSSSSTITLYMDQIQIFQTDEDTLTYTLNADELSKRDLLIVAEDESGKQKEITFEFIVYEPPLTADLPPGIEDGINYTSSTNVVLSLFAPHKNFAYVIGDFNDWQIDPAYYMKRTPDGNRYWLEINQLEPQKEYIFQYLVDGIKRIADPYTEKISDPWHDKWITDTTYPNLIAYPEGKTTEIASVLQTDQEVYTWQVTDFEKPEIQDLIIYEMLLRDFVSNHDFNTLTDSLSYFKQLGVNAIELMPFSEFEGNDSWGYNPSFYFATDKYYGPKQDVKRFIDEAHKQGIAVIQDIVLNHAYGQCPLVRLYSDDMARNPWFNQTSPNPVFAWGFDFNHESQFTKEFVDRVTSFWLKEYNVDGFRFDFTKGFTNTPGDGGGYDAARIAILKRMADQVWATDSTAYVILEHFADNREEIELSDYGMMIWGNMTYNYGEAAKGFHDGGRSNFSRVSYKTRFWNNPNLVAYMESHDEERMMFKNIDAGRIYNNYSVKDTLTALQRTKLAAAFFFTVPGPKMIWQFEELGYDYSIDYKGRLGMKPIRWDYLRDPHRRSVFDVFSGLIKLKTDHPAFASTDFELSVASGLKSIHINHESMNVVIVGNFAVAASTINPNFQHSGQWYDLFSGDSLIVGNTQEPIALQPGEFFIFTDVKIEESGVVTSVEHESNTIVNSYALYNNYPNPFNPSTSISYKLPQTTDVNIIVFNMKGQLVRTLVSGRQNSGTHRIVWNGLNDNGEAVSSGVYIYRLESPEFTQSRKMLLIK